MAPFDGALKPIGKYIALGQRMDKINPIVAYYARLHALALGKDIPNRTKDDTVTLMQIMDWLEGQKPKVGEDKEEHKAIVLKYVETAFEAADKEDQAGNAGKNTVAKFQTAWLLLDLLEHFGELPEELSQCRTYCKWKITDILKALREGRKPTPGGFQSAIGGDNEFGDDDDGKEALEDDADDRVSANSSSSASSSSVSGPSPSPLSSHGPPAPVPAAWADVPIRPSSHDQPSGKAPGAASKARSAKPARPAVPVVRHMAVEALPAALTWNRGQVVNHGEDLVQEALGALRFDDVDTAVDRLKQALAVLMVQYGQGSPDDDDDLTTDSEEDDGY